MLQKWRPPQKTSITARRAQTPATDGLAPVEADLNITVLVSDYIKRNRRQKLACIYRSKVASSLWSWVQHTLKTKHWFNLVITFFGKVSGQEKYAGHHFWKHPFRLKSFETCESQARSVHLFFQDCSSSDIAVADNNNNCRLPIRPSAWRADRMGCFVFPNQQSCGSWEGGFVQHMSY